MSKLLLIEDEEVIRVALRRFLTKNGFEIMEADSVESVSYTHLTLPTTPYV